MYMLIGILSASVISTKRSIPRHGGGNGRRGATTVVRQGRRAGASGRGDHASVEGVMDHGRGFAHP